MNTAPSLVIFDCDGVLVDSERLGVRVEAEALAELGWPLTEQEVVERFMGRTSEAMRADVEAHLGRPLHPDWVAELDRRYEAVFRTELQAVDGVADTLDRLAIPTCVASSADHAKLRLTLGLTGLLDRFEGRIFSAQDVARGKPEPDLFLHAARTMGATPATSVVVEDSVPGVLAARAAGMRVLGYSGGLSAEAALRDAGAVPFADMRQVPELIEGTTR